LEKGGGVVKKPKDVEDKVYTTTLGIVGNNNNYLIHKALFLDRLYKEELFKSVDYSVKNYRSIT